MNTLSFSFYYNYIFERINLINSYLYLKLRYQIKGKIHSLQLKIGKQKAQGSKTIVPMTPRLIVDKKNSECGSAHPAAPEWRILKKSLTPKFEKCNIFKFFYHRHKYLL